MQAIVCPALILLACVGFAQAREFKGTLDSELSPIEQRQQVSNFAIATDTHKELLAGMIGKDDRVFAGDVWSAIAFVVEAAGGKTILYVDVNADKNINANESFALQPDKNPQLAGITRVSFPLAGPYYTSFPVKVYVYKKQDREDSRTVSESPFAVIRGHVEIDGKPLLVECAFHSTDDPVHLDSGWQGMDVNGDGVIDESSQALELLYAKNEVLVFHIGNLYLSTKTLNLARGEVVLRSHPATAYDTLEMKPGSKVPDFAFTDFSGKTKKLSEFQGKYVLLDFWASWCAPCVAAFPHLREVYDKFHNRGFEIIGMNGDEEQFAARKMIATKGMIVWPQATFASIRTTLAHSFRIRAWPTYILLDRAGRVVSTRFEDLQGAALDKYLENLLR